MDADTPKRRQGGQPGNTNALKHGFFSRRFKELEINDLEATMEVGLENEVALLRVIMRRAFNQIERTEPADIQTWERTLGMLGMAATRIASLLRTQKVLTGEASGMSETISQALAEVVKELKIK